MAVRNKPPAREVIAIRLWPALLNALQLTSIQRLRRIARIFGKHLQFGFSVASRTYGNVRVWMHDADWVLIPLLNGCSRGYSTLFKLNRIGSNTAFCHMKLAQRSNTELCTEFIENRTMAGPLQRMRMLDGEFLLCINEQKGTTAIFLRVVAQRRATESPWNTESREKE